MGKNACKSGPGYSESDAADRSSSFECFFPFVSVTDHTLPPFPYFLLEAYFLTIVRKVKSKVKSIFTVTVCILVLSESTC